MFDSELMHHMHAELILEHLNFKNFTVGACPQTPLDMAGSIVCVGLLTSAPYTKISTYTAVKPCIRMRY